jgi:hypothetical protein
MHTIRLDEAENIWHVGYHDPQTNAWVTILQYSEEATAMRLVNYLNGGTGKPFED